MFTKALVSLSLVAVALGVTINTPSSLIECQPAALEWSAGTAPYYVSILPGGQPSATPLEQLGSFTGTTTTWTVNLASGVAVTLSVTDATGAINYSQQVTIQAGTSSSCLTSSAGTTAAAAGTSAASASSGGRTPVSAGAATTAAGASTAAASAASTRAATSTTATVAATSAKASTGTTASSSSAAAASSSKAASSGTALSTAGALGFFGVLFAIVA